MLKEKYAFIEDGEALPARTVSKLNSLTEPPAALKQQKKYFLLIIRLYQKLLLVGNLLSVLCNIRLITGLK